jgi:hypothetical protein
LYGQEKNFEDFQTAMEVYKLAHEMQITSLLHAVDQVLLTSIDVIEALQVYHLFVRLENHKGLKICKEVAFLAIKSENRPPVTILIGIVTFLSSYGIISDIVCLDPSGDGSVITH